MTLRIVDRFSAARDPKLAVLVRALDPAEVDRCIVPLVRGGLARGGEARVALREIEVTRHKPGRRCLVAYRFEIAEPAAAPRTEIFFGKVRARRADTATHALLEALWQAGLRPDGGGAASVPEPIGVVRELHLSLQRRVPGRLATELVEGPGGVALMRRVAEAIHALHTAGVPARRSHGLRDELQILHERLPRLTEARPEWSRRLERLLAGCERLAGSLEEPPPCGIHRDFYPDQVIVDGDRLTLLDLDLYAAGDPALDVGNFAGHLTEHGLRFRGDPTALRDREEALEERYLALSPHTSRAALRVYATLTLVRHVHISTLFPERRPLTPALLELCEERLGIGARA